MEESILCLSKAARQLEQSKGEEQQEIRGYIMEAVIGMNFGFYSELGKYWGFTSLGRSLQKKPLSWLCRENSVGEKDGSQETVIIHVGNHGAGAAV